MRILSKRKINIVQLLFFVSIGLPTISWSYNVDSISNLFPGQMGVFTKFSQHLFIEHKGSTLVSSSLMNREILLLNDNANSMFNTETIYHSYFNPLINVEAGTMLPDNMKGKIVRSTSVTTRPSASESVFYDDSKETVVNYTNLSKGTSTTLKYSLQHNEINMLPRFYFQSYIPILQSTFSVTYPKDVEIESVIKGTPVNWIHKSTVENKKTITTTWQANMVPKGQAYSQAPSFGYYSPHIVLYVKSYVDPKTKNKISLLGTEENLFQYLNRFVKNINLTEDEDIKNKVAELTANAASDNEKAASIYKWVQSNIRYIAFEDSLGGFVPREASLVFHRRFGDCKDMSSLLRAMCKAAGMDARYVWVGTRDIPYSIREIPTPVLFNHMICAVKIDDKWTFMDGTDPIIKYGEMPQALQGKEAIIQEPAGDFEVVSIPVTPMAQSQLIDSSFVQIKGGTLTGNIAIHLTGYFAYNLKSILKYKNQSEKDKFFNNLTRRGNNKYVQNSFDAYNANTNNSDVSLKASFDLPDYIKEVGNEYYVNLNLIKSLAGNKIDTFERKAPMENDFKNIVKTLTILEIPKGYAVKYIPDSKEQKFDGIGSFKVNYTATDSSIILAKEIDIDVLYVESDSFWKYNNMVDALQQLYKESIVITKK